MERLKVKNFLAIKEADFNVKKFNLIIGKQATGKSTLTRLIHFFRESLKECLNSAAFHGNLNFKKIFINNLFSYFPGYLWEKQKFNINYKLEDVEIKISNSNGKIRIGVNKAFKELLLITKEFHKETKVAEVAEEDFSPLDRFDLIQWYLNSKNRLKDSFHKVYVEENFYIPSGRSFFSILRANIFSLISIFGRKLKLDPTLYQFGELYEIGMFSFDRVIGKYKAEYSDFLKDLNKICGGNLISYSDNVSMELENGLKIKIEDASSGQQEIVPVLMILLTHSLEKELNDIFTIEEPEAHLFPETQRDVIFFISKVCNTFNKSVIITTHSPYILSAFNILLLANDIMNKKNKEKIEKIIGRNTAIKFEDITACTIEDGILKSFLNHETKLLDTNIIDKATEAFEDLFDKLNEIGLEG